MHENLIHIGFNMYVLYILGQMLEPALGRLKFGTIYAVSLLCGSFGALLVTPHSPTVGASGAVFGLMGAAAVEMRARQIPVMQSGVGGLILLNLVISFALPGISWGGHIGGLIGGAVAMLVLQLGDRYRRQALALAGCAAIGVAAFAGSIAVSKATEVETTPTPGDRARSNQGSDASRMASSEGPTLIPMTLADQEVEERLAGGEWRREGAAIVREWTFADFAQAIAFVNRVAEVAEAANHHPDIAVHGWNKVRLELSTHSQGGLTEADFGMAARIDTLA